ncbi:hypothetical protein SBF1_8980001 [Candidatus Desulfosporosinus infrequens]|uniref:DUF551 domain-containing protein n=1 Tax=Candidatus Desulfosporosinus infrequens TaxID=2043169 RepID=A0A2U3LWL7_9FIRM|nr:hypothetical protein SBF1_8980001 [Candidatus Desulfosporosinus infrequens]
MPMFKGSVYPDGSATFMERWSYHNDSEFGPTGDTVTHWMYYPEPPKYSTKYNAEKDHLEFIYEGEEEPNESIN